MKRREGVESVKSAKGMKGVLGFRTSVRLRVGLILVRSADTYSNAEALTGFTLTHPHVAQV